ncbi:MAG: tryptophan synthase subunit alpha [Omnitrophica bacterium RBG_13_46_9]|nr:MAG: tryptophan synthase subunit alpha [Omnitrophica bacterium RBG_13_46_9]
MNRIDALFTRLEKERKKAFIVYITAGDPALRTTERLVAELEKAGVDLVELGIPFSDPLADGPTIQKASQRALSKGANIRSILHMVRSVRKHVRLPIVFMTYYNLLLHYGLERFVMDAKGSGADGVIIPDLPPEEAKELIAISRKADFATIFLAAPTSTKARLKKIADKSTGFIYYVSLTGVTGARSRLPQDISKNVGDLKRITGKPICVGFGISTPSQVKRILRLADGIIVGSAIIKVIEKNIGKKDLYKKVSSFVSKLEKAIHGK